MKDTSDDLLLQKLKELLDKYHGGSDAVLVLGGESKQIIKLPQKIDGSDSLIDDLQSLLPKEDVKYQ
jgi:hypothetical protein